LWLVVNTLGENMRERFVLNYLDLRIYTHFKGFRLILREKFGLNYLNIRIYTL